MQNPTDTCSSLNIWNCTTKVSFGRKVSTSLSKYPHRPRQITESPSHRGFVISRWQEKKDDELRRMSHDGHTMFFNENTAHDARRQTTSRRSEMPCQLPQALQGLAELELHLRRLGVDIPVQLAYCRHTAGLAGTASKYALHPSPTPAILRCMP